MQAFAENDPRLRIFSDVFDAAPELDWTPSTGDVLNALWENETLIGQIQQRVHEERADQSTFDESYDVFGDIAGFELDASEFAFSRSPEETAIIKARILKRRRGQLITQQATTAQTLFTGLLTQAVDPVNWLVMAGPVSSGLSIARTLGAGFSRGAMAGGLSSGAQEIGLQLFQPDRTVVRSVAQTFLAAGIGGTLFGSLMLGKRWLALSGKSQEEMGEHITDTMMNGPGPQTTQGRFRASDGTMDTRRYTQGSTRTSTVHTKGTSEAFGAEKVLEKGSPGLRGLNHPFHSVADATEDLVQTGAFLTKNWEEGGATRIPVETAVINSRATLGEVISDIGHAYNAYRMRLAGSANEPGVLSQMAMVARDKFTDLRGESRTHLSIEEFRAQVTATRRSGQPHDVPEVNVAAEKARQVWADFQERALKSGMLDAEDVVQNFVPRLWNPALVRKHMDRLIAIIQDDQMSRLPIEMVASKRELRAQLEMIIKTGESMEGVDLAGVVGPKGIFKPRQIDVSDDVVAEFLENDINLLLKVYHRHASVDLALKEKFGSVDMRKQIDAIRKEGEAKIAGTQDANEAAQILSDMNAGLRDVEAMRDILRGVYKLPDDPYDLPSQFVRVAMEFNNVTMLGGVTIASLTDPFRIVMTGGLEAAMPMLKLMVTDFKQFKVAANVAKEVGVGWDMQLQTTAMALVSHGELPARFAKGERILGYGTNLNFIINLLSPWNAFMKGAAGASIAHRIVDWSIRVSKGTATPNMKARLKAAYIDEQTAREIAQLYGAFGEDVKGLKMPNIRAWANQRIKHKRVKEARSSAAAKADDINQDAYELNLLDAEITLREKLHSAALKGTAKSESFMEVGTAGPTRQVVDALEILERSDRFFDSASEVGQKIAAIKKTLQRKTPLTKKQSKVLQTSIREIQEELDELRSRSTSTRPFSEGDPRSARQLRDDEERLDITFDLAADGHIPSKTVDDLIEDAQSILRRAAKERDASSDRLTKELKHFKKETDGMKALLKKSEGELNKKRQNADLKDSDTARIETPKNSRRREDGSIIAAWYNEKHNTVFVDEFGVRESFSLRAWETPKVKGVKPLPEGTIKNIDDWRDFLIEHELAHADFKRIVKESGTESLSEFEQRINEIALKRMGKRQFTFDVEKTLKVFKAAVARDVDMTIVTPGAGDQPLFAHTVWGRLMTQYKSFVFASASRVMLPGIQARDAAALHGAMMMVFMGGMVTMLRDKQNGRPTADSVHGFIIDGIDQSGITSWIFTLNNAVEALSDNRYGIRPMTGTAPWWDTSLRWKVGTVFGPTAGQAVRAGEILTDIASGEADWRTRKSAWRFLPYNNNLFINMGTVFNFEKWYRQMTEEPDDTEFHSEAQPLPTRQRFRRRFTYEPTPRREPPLEDAGFSRL